MNSSAGDTAEAHVQHGPGGLRVQPLHVAAVLLEQAGGGLGGGGAIAGELVERADGEGRDAFGGELVGFESFGRVEDRAGGARRGLRGDQSPCWGLLGSNRSLTFSGGSSSIGMCRLDSDVIDEES